MKITIDETILNKYDLTIPEVSLMLISSFSVNTGLSKVKLVDKGYIIDLNNNTLVITKKGKELLSTILLDSESTKSSDSEERFLELAQKLREIYPSGKKQGTPYMWRDSNNVIAKKLRTLVIKHKVNFTDEQAIRATEEYVKSFNGNYQYMQLLKYFISKNIINPNGETEMKSEFLSYIENLDDINEESTDWTTELK